MSDADTITYTESYPFGVTESYLRGARELPDPVAITEPEPNVRGD